MSKLVTNMSASAFVPREHFAFLRSPRCEAIVKDRPESFRVQEESFERRKLTVSAGSDGPVLGGVGENVIVTLVKRDMSTFTAIGELAEELNVPIGNISIAGLKDTCAVTAQRVVIKGVPLAVVARHCRFVPLNGRAGWFIKDPAPYDRELVPGMLAGNDFAIRVLLPGLKKNQIDTYVDPLLKRLAEGGMQMPNLYDRQRLGRRQDGLNVAHLFVTRGVEPAIKRFLLKRSPLESEGAGLIRTRLTEVWEDAKARALQTGSGIASQSQSFARMAEILTERDCDGRNHVDYGMAIEFQLVKKVLEKGNFEEAVSELKSLCSLWAATYQSYWFNQVIGHALTGRLRLKNNNAFGPLVPMFADDPVARSFYEDNCLEAIPESIDTFVSRMFLTPATAGNCSWRPAFTTVNNLKHNAEDGVWNVKFGLRTGSYATTFLSLLFSIRADANVYA